MPAPSKYQTTLELFEALSEVTDFPYSLEEMLSFLNQTNLKIKPTSKSTEPRIISPWQCFLKGKAVSDIATNKANWVDVQKNEEEFIKYQQMAFKINVANGFTPNEDNTDVIKKISTSTYQKLVIEKARLIQQNNGTLSDKPIFTGKKPDTSLSNFKEYLKHLNHLDHISKDTLKQLRTEHNFSSTYSEQQPWHNFIRNNMTIINEL